PASATTWMIKSRLRGLVSQLQFAAAAYARNSRHSGIFS
ncbi:putative ribosome biogenesis protein nep1, partial [Toxoplasma gondii TgCatPRC2]